MLTHFSEVPTDGNCGANQTTIISKLQSGQIYSPDYPDTYHNNAYCSWLIKAVVGEVVTLTFVHMDVQRR